MEAWRHWQFELTRIASVGRTPFLNAYFSSNNSRLPRPKYFSVNWEGLLAGNCGTENNGCENETYEPPY